MSLVVEDGTGRADAESYISVVEHKAYCDARGISYASRTDPQLEQDARRAVAFMLGRYRPRWSGVRRKTTQALDHPRQGMPIKDAPFEAYYPYDVVAKEVKWAQSELMVRVAADGELEPDLERTIASETVGPISTTYVDGAPEQKRFPAIEAILAPLFQFSSGLRLTRA